MERLSLRQSIGRRWGRGPTDPAAASGETRPARATRKAKGIALLGALLIAGLLLAGIATSFAPASAPTILTPAGGPAGSARNGAPTNQAGTAPGDATTQDALGTGKQTGAPAWDRMVIRTATLALTVKSVATSLDQVRGLAAAHGGYVTQSDSHQDGDYTVATLTLQVPAQEFDTVIPLLRQMGVKPVQETISSSDVTAEYIDLQAELRNLQATEARMLALQQKADALDDILTLDRELRQVQGQIEQTQGRINYLSTRAAMSTITVSLYPEALPAPPVVTGWDPLPIAGHAWDASLDLLAGAAGLIITVAVFLWWAVPLLVVARWLFRARRRSAATA